MAPDPTLFLSPTLLLYNHFPLSAMKHLKQEFDRLSFKEVILYSMSVVCLFSGIVATFLDLYIEPVGVIHNSVLMYFAICSSFCGSLLGISAHYSTQLEKFKSQILASLGDGGHDADPRGRVPVSENERS